MFIFACFPLCHYFSSKIEMKIYKHMLIFSFNPEYALRGFFMKEKHASPTNIPLAAKPYKYKVKNEVFFLSCCFSFLLFFFLVILFCVNKTCLKWKKKKKKKNLTKSHSFKHRYCQIFIKAGLKILNQIKYFFLKKGKALQEIIT